MAETLSKLRFEVERRLALRLFSSPLACQLLAGWRANPVDGRRVSSDLAAMLRMAELQGMAQISTLTPEQARLDVARSVALCSEEQPRDVDVHTVFFDGPASKLRVKVYVPRGIGPQAPAVLYVHGGGWVTGDVDVYDVSSGHLASSSRSIVFSLDYRLAPEHQFPSQPDDCLAAWRWLESQTKSFDFDPARVAIAGDSAGGSLSALLAQECARDAFRPALQMLIYPSLDATFAHRSHETLREGFFLTRDSIDWYLAQYAGPNPDRRHPRLSPLLAPDPMPNVPALIFAAGLDPLRDEAEAYAARLRAAGTPVYYEEFSDMVHGFALMSGVAPAARRATQRMRTILAEVFRASDIAAAVSALT